jgi:hypothetical protein
MRWTLWSLQQLTRTKKLIEVRVSTERRPLIYLDQRAWLTPTSLSLTESGPTGLEDSPAAVFSCGEMDAFVDWCETAASGHS